ncbi:hypothetical protein [Legionella sp. WA2024007413]
MYTPTEIDNSSFRNLLHSTIAQIDSFYGTFKDKYETNDKGKLNFLTSYTNGSSAFRKDILDDSKYILESLKRSPPRNLEELKGFFEATIGKLQSKCLKNGFHESSLLNLLKEICSNLESINSNELKENTSISFGK